MTLAVLHRTATVLGAALTQPGLKLWLLHRQDVGAAWRLVRLVYCKRDGDQSGAQAELDPFDGSWAEVSVPTLLSLFC